MSCRPPRGSASPGRAMAQTWPGFAVTAGSERPGMALIVADYDPAWPQTYERWRQRVAAALGCTATRIEHVGSTSVEGGHQVRVCRTAAQVPSLSSWS
jgi:hypothetical protein